jgi:hypothetical protein
MVDYSSRLSPCNTARADVAVTAVTATSYPPATKMRRFLRFPSHPSQSRSFYCFRRRWREKGWGTQIVTAVTELAELRQFLRRNSGMVCGGCDCGLLSREYQSVVKDNPL